MRDIFLEWEGDLAVSSSGDLAVANGTTAINQRICRRLLTNPGAYLWNLDYGGGLSRFVGSAINTATIEAVVTTQLSLESAIPFTPAPRVTTKIMAEANNYVVTTITYADPGSMQPVVINVPSGLSK